MKQLKGKTKRWLAMLLTLMMIFGSAISAQADSLTADDSNVVTSGTTVSISNIPADKELGSSGITFTTYQIVNATYDADSNSLEYHLTEWAKNALVNATASASGQYASEALALEAILEAVILGGATAPKGQSAEEQTQILNTLAAHADKTEYSATWSGASASGTDPYTATATLPVGSYLVMASCSDMTFLNMMVSVDVSGTTGTAADAWVLTAKNAVLKGKELTIDKNIVKTESNATANVDVDTVQIGDTVSFEIIVDVPHFPANATTTTFKVTDTPENMDIDLSKVEVYGVKGTASTKLTNASVEESTAGVLTVDFSNIYAGTFYDTTTASYPYDQVKITYEAKVLSSAALGDVNKNEAKLEYTSNPYSNTSTNTSTDTTVVYTYGVDLTKYGEGTDKLANAVFNIKKSGEDAAIEFVEESGVYKVYDGDISVNPTTDLTTNNEGTLSIVGLDAGVTYVLSEAKAPSGYYLNTNTLEFTITAATDATTREVLSTIDSVEEKEKDSTGAEVSTGGSWTKTVDANGAAKFAVSLTDTKLPALPATGGIGIMVFSVMGVVLMSAAVFVFFFGKRREENEN